MAYKIPASSGGSSPIVQFVVRNVSLLSTGTTQVSTVPFGKVFVPISFSIVTISRVGVSPGAATVSLGTVGATYNNLMPPLSYNQPNTGFLNTAITVQIAVPPTSSSRAYFNVSAAATGASTYTVDLFLNGFYTD
jgi:hypothetical protein